MMAERGVAVLEAVGVSKSFPGVRALDDVTLEARSGELTAVLGENGAGKSTLMNVLSGVYPPDRGEVRLDGVPVAFASPREARESGVSVIYQELDLVPELGVAENIFLGREPLTRLGLIDSSRMREEARELSRRLGLVADPRAPVSSLRVGEQQIVAIARALALQARVVIMDEPTSAISEHEIEILFDIVRSLLEQGVAILYITHKLEELSRIGERYAVLRDGKLVGSGRIGDVGRDELIGMMVGRERRLPERPRVGDRGEGEVRLPERPRVGDRGEGEVSGELLRVEGLSLQHPGRPGDFRLRDISFALKRGEVLGVFGLMGAGRTELCETLFGLHPCTATGEITVHGVRVEIRSPRDAIAAGIGWTPEDRKRDGLFLQRSVAENVSLASLERVERWGLLDRAREAEHVEEHLARLALKTPSLGQRVVSLSGGNQQKVILARWLATRPRVLLLDEPTRGIDVGAKGEIHALLGELAASGLGIVLISSELPEILAGSDRIIVLCEGEKTTELSREEATEERLVRAALPRSPRDRGGAHAG